MSRTSPSLLSPTQGLSLAVETLLMRREKDQSDNNFNFNCDNFLTQYASFHQRLMPRNVFPGYREVMIFQQVSFTNQLAASEGEPV